MATSGSNNGTLLPYVAGQLLEEAATAAGIAPESLTPEIVFKALDKLNLILTSLLNRGIHLWKRQQFILPLYQGVLQVPLPPGCNLVTQFVRRTLLRVTGIASFTDQGGVAANAFDDNFATLCTQTAINGSIGQQFSTPTQVTQVGVLSGTTGTFTLSFEYSQDGINYTSLDQEIVTFTANGQWFWADLQSPPSGALYWRVRSTGAVPFAVEEIFFGNNPSEITYDPWNLDEYNAQPNKYSPGPVTNWYQHRNISGPLLYVWQVPDFNSRYDTLVVWATQYINQVSQLTQSLDFPQRWFDAVTAMLAVKLCDLPEADPSKFQKCQLAMQNALMLAEAEERDPSPTRYDLGLQYYTV